MVWPQVQCDLADAGRRKFCCNKSSLRSTTSAPYQGTFAGVSDVGTLSIVANGPNVADGDAGCGVEALLHRFFIVADLSHFLMVISPVYVALQLVSAQTQSIYCIPVGFMAIMACHPGQRVLLWPMSCAWGGGQSVHASTIPGGAELHPRPLWRLFLPCCPYWSRCLSCRGAARVAERSYCSTLLCTHYTI